MTTLSPTKARSNLTSLLKKAAAGEEIGIRYRGTVIALRPVELEGYEYLREEYGVTPKEWARFVKRMDARIRRERKAGKIHTYHGDIEALLKD